MATILVDRNYPSVFNTPRVSSKHRILRSRIPGTLGRVWQPLAGVAVWNPIEEFDLVHCFNAIPPFTEMPWIVTFESVLPRTIGHGGDILQNMLRDRLLSDSCRYIVAISEYAVRRMRAALIGWPALDTLHHKLRVIHPNVPLRSDAKDYPGGPLTVTFIGNEFARKGGIAILRMAKLAKQKRLPITFNLISKLAYGTGIYTDCQDSARYEEDLKLMNLDNVRFRRALPNSEVLRLLDKSHFILLPTLHDTYGFSLLEGMAGAVPAIASNTAAIPEFVKHRKNGFLLPMDNDELGHWAALRTGNVCWDVLSATYDSLAGSAIECLAETLDTPTLWNQMSRGAVEQITWQHEAALVGAQLETLYTSALRT